MKKEEIKNKLKEMNLRMLFEDDYKQKEKIDIEDIDGYKYYVQLGNVLKIGFNSSIITQFNKQEYNLHNLKLYLKLNNIQLEVVGNPIIKSRGDKIEFKCSCGKIFRANIHEVIGTKNKHQCNDCGIYSRFNSRRHDFNYYKEEIENLGFILLDSEFKVDNIKQKFNIEDEEGYRYYVELSSIKNSNKLLKFYKTNPHTIYNIKKYIKDNNINTELLSNTYISNSDLLIFKCECGNIYETTWGRFYSCQQHRCQNCSGVKSNLEYLVEKELLNNNINYKYQYCIDDCKDIRVLPFDFAIFKEENKLSFLIEIQGRQHYVMARFGKGTDEETIKNFKALQRHDYIKKEYCNKNNIKLIEIPYWEFKNGNYKNIINTLIRNM